MRVHPPTEWQRHRVGSVAAVANLVPLVGVLALGWNVYSLLVLYWIEGLVTVLLAAAKALFAERGSPGLPDIEPLHELREKRGGWRPLSRLPAVYPRNVPFAASILGFWTVAVLPASVLYWLAATPVIRPSRSLLVGGVGLVITQLHEFLSDYLAGQEYADVSAQEILREPLQLGLVTLTLGLLASAGDRSGGLVLLTGIVVVKTTTSVYRIVTDHTDLPVPSVLDGAFDGSHAEPRPDIDTPDGPVRGRVSVDAAPVLLGSLPMIAFGFAHRSTFAILIGLAFAALTGGWVWLVLGQCSSSSSPVCVSGATTCGTGRSSIAGTRSNSWPTIRHSEPSSGLPRWTRRRSRSATQSRTDCSTPARWRYPGPIPTTVTLNLARLPTSAQRSRGSNSP
ncbi:DUF6498-containing protein [Halobellus marinus]|uniref:DUF6498-containing protein n=1 Tax=Halobellus marinus TaxID=3075123 RepID=UPI0028A6D943|nr:DUF6498-containing protein [Halobellus sp. DFY28]